MCFQSLSKYGFYRVKSATPMKRLHKKDWYNLHKDHQKKLDRCDSETIIIGDSIASGLFRFKEVWMKYFQNVLNLGIGGDSTQHVIWRAENLTINKNVKNIIIQCGSNNTSSYTPYDIANSIYCIALLFMAKNRHLNIVICSLFPRHDVSNQIINEINLKLESICFSSTEKVSFLKNDSNWLLKNGNLNSNIFWHNNLHLSKDGYSKYAKSIKRHLQQIHSSFSQSNKKPLENKTYTQTTTYDTNFPPLKKHTLLSCKPKFSSKLREPSKNVSNFVRPVNVIQPKDTVSTLRKSVLNQNVCKDVSHVKVSYVHQINVPKSTLSKFKNVVLML